MKRTHEFQPDTLAVVHVAHMVHRALWLMIANEDHVAEGQPGSWLRVPDTLGAAAHETMAAMADAAVCALGEFADALPVAGGRPRPVQAAAGAAVDRYVELCEGLFRQSLALHGSETAAGGSGGRGGGGGVACDVSMDDGMDAMYAAADGAARGHALPRAVAVVAAGALDEAGGDAGGGGEAAAGGGGGHDAAAAGGQPKYHFAASQEHLERMVQPGGAQESGSPLLPGEVCAHRPRGACVGSHSADGLAALFLAPARPVPSAPPPP